MATVMKSATIPASIDAVWAVLADFAAISQWAPNVDHSCLMSDQTEGVGMVRRIQTGRTTIVETVAGPRPPQQGIAKAVGRKLGQASDEMLAGLATHFSTSPEQPGQQQEQHA